MLTRFTRLERLDLECNHWLTGAGMAVLATALCSLSGSLTHLDLQQCVMGAEDPVTLAAALPHLTSLTLLDLSHHAMVGPVYCSIAQALTPLRCLQHLNLEGNVVNSYEAAAPLAAALLGPMSLTFLAVTVHDRGDNSTGQGCFSTLAPGLLKQALSLRHLDLCASRLDVSCWRAAAPAGAHCGQPGRPLWRSGRSGCRRISSKNELILLCVKLRLYN